LGQIEISFLLHKVREVVISNHTDCGAYNSAGPFSSFEEECRFHVEEMKKAKDLISVKFPSLKVRMVLGKIMPDGNVEVE
jgi:carbonic anhydrase